MTELKSKVCTKCKKEKYLFEFHSRKKNFDGLSTYCKDCHKEATVAWKKKSQPKNVDKMTWKNNYYGW